MSFLSHHAHNIQKQITCQLNTFLISLKTHAIKVSITMFRVRDVVLRNALCFPTTKLTLTFLCLFSQPSLVTDDVFAFYAISCYYFFSLKDQFLILLRSAAAAQKILEAQVFFEQCYYS